MKTFNVSKWCKIPAFMMMLACPLITSCGSEEEDLFKKDDPTNNGGNGSTNTPTLMSSTEQKIFLEEAGEEFLGYIKSSDFQSVVDLYNYVGETYSDYKTDEVEDWYIACLEDITQVLGVGTDEDNWNVYNYNNYSRLYAVSNFKGHFTANDNGCWEYSEANDLQFSFTDQNGANCVIKLATGGNTKKVYVGDEDYYQEGYYDYNLGKYISYLDRFENYIEIPEYILVTFTQGGANLSTLNLITNLSMIDENFNLEQDQYAMAVKMTVKEYEWNFEKVSYKAQQNAEISFNMKKGSQMLFAMGAYVDGKVDMESGEVTSAKNANLNFSILNDKVKVAGNCLDVIKYCNKLEKAAEHADDEKTYKSYINEANDMLDLNVYYDGTNTKQAYISLEPFYEEDYYYGYNGYDKYGEWICEPVICFEDGTSYSTFATFFDEDDFKSLINTFEKLVKDFEKLAEE